MKLSHFAHGRDNNFNLIRMMAASAVLVTHSFALAIGTPAAEPFRETLGMTMGSIAVDVFFVASGFLVSGSLLNKKDMIEFVWARALRILPALWVAVLLTVFVLGPFFTGVSSHEYFISRQTYSYLIRNVTLLFGVNYGLPSVFDGNPYPQSVNGSLWTLPYEVRMYLLLAFLWVVLGFISKRLRGRLMQVGIVTISVMSGLSLLVAHALSIELHVSVRLLFMFFTGGAFFVLREHVELSRRVFVALVLCLVFSTFDKKAFFVAYLVSLAYVLFYLAYVPGGRLRAYNSVGDYSYGIYIYSFPVQQMIAALMPGVSVVDMILLSGAITLCLSLLSWHLLEKRMMRFKNGLVARTKAKLSVTTIVRAEGG